MESLAQIGEAYRFLFMEAYPYWIERIVWAYKDPAAWWAWEIQNFHIDLSSERLLHLLVCTFIWALVRPLYHTLISRPLARALNLTEPSAKSQNALKWDESMWKATYYMTMVGLEWLIIQKHNLWEDPTYMWLELPYGPGVQQPPEVYWMCVAQLSFYFYAIWGVYYMDAKRGDSQLMVVHHLLTILLITFGWGNNYHWICITVLFVHDAADGFLETSKMTVYLKESAQARGMRRERAFWRRFGDCCFATFIAVWVVTRLYFYPTKVLMSVVYGTMVPDWPGPTIYTFFVLWLTALQVIHIYWSYLISRIAYRSIVLGEEGDDIREDKKTVMRANRGKGTSLKNSVNGKTKVNGKSPKVKS
eukprot:Clim_evm56s144 gene=Clim_evmTU56s144